MSLMSRLSWVVGGVVAIFSAACGSSGNTGGNGGGTSGCVPGTTIECACLGGTKGIQSCKDDGKGYAACQCEGTTSTGSGTGGATGTTSSSGTGTGVCGNGIIEPTDNCGSPGSEFFCAADCNGGTGGSDAGAGGACAGHVYYAGKYDGAPSVWAMLPAAGGNTGLDAGNSQCKALGVGADHVCDYDEIQAAFAAKEAAFMGIAQGTTVWVQRTTSANVNGTPSAAGPGGRCNNWTYATNHISDGEYITFDTAGTPNFHLDNDTVFDPNNPGVHTQADLQCGGVNRSILCCYQACN